MSWVRIKGIYCCKPKVVSYATIPNSVAVPTSTGRCYYQIIMYIVTMLRRPFARPLIVTNRVRRVLRL